MNIRSRLSRRQALTLIEALALLAVIVLLVALILPMFAKGRVRSGPPCVSMLKQVGLAARMWSNDHNERFPWMVSANEGGTKEFQSSPEVFRHFVVMSNEMSSPWVLRCPYDTARTRANSFSAGEPVANKNISYFVGLDADEHHPQRILSGDRNLTGGTTNGHLLIYSTNSNPGWGTNIHNLHGNIALSDGSVQQFNSESLARQVQAAFATMTNAEMRLAIPRVPGE
jgi:competence protein ComGC